MDRIKFTLDVHLGKLAKLLRLCGFDSYFDRDYDDQEIIRFSESANRIILTRDKQLLKSRDVTAGYCVRSQDPDEQLREVLQHFDLKDKVNPFSRCMECNSLLENVLKEKITEYLLPGTKVYYQNFKKCPGCARIYWEGSHYERMRKYITSVIKTVN